MYNKHDVGSIMPKFHSDNWSIKRV